MISLAVLGDAGVGRASLCNALFGTDFEVDPARRHDWPESADVVYGGREVRVSKGKGAQGDAYLFLCDKDLTGSEHAALARIARPVALVLNKTDRLSQSQRRQLLAVLRERTQLERVVSAAAAPVAVSLVYAPDGSAREQVKRLPPVLTEVVGVLEDLMHAAETSARVVLREGSRRLAREVRDALKKGPAR